MPYTFDHVRPNALPLPPCRPLAVRLGPASVADVEGTHVGELRARRAPVLVQHRALEQSGRFRLRRSRRPVVPRVEDRPHRRPVDVDRLAVGRLTDPPHARHEPMPADNRGTL